MMTSSVKMIVTRFEALPAMITSVLNLVKTLSFMTMSSDWVARKRRKMTLARVGVSTKQTAWLAATRRLAMRRISFVGPSSIKRFYLTLALEHEQSRGLGERNNLRLKYLLDAHLLSVEVDL